MTNLQADSESTQLSTVGDWIHKATTDFTSADLFYGHGTDSAGDEAVQLVLQALRLEIDSDERVLARPVSLPERQLLDEWIERRIKERKPLPYITKSAWFMGMPFYVDERVLIPRSPLGEWIECAFDPWLDEKPTRICDIGTGSACLAIACAHVFPEAQVDAVDLSTDALAVAKINVEQHQLQNRVNLVQADCLDKLLEARYELIISNPPYVTKAEMDDLPPEYQHEPRMALEADEDGLKIVMKILRQAALQLSPGGILVMDVGYADEALMQRMPNVPFTWLDLQRGGHGIFLLTAEDLKELRV